MTPKGPTDPSPEALAAARPLAGSGMVVDPEHAERLYEIARALDAFASQERTRLLERLDTPEVVTAAAKAWCDQDYDSVGTFERLQTEEERDDFRAGARAAIGAIKRILETPG